MSDNRKRFTGAEVHLPAYFLVDAELFDFYSFVPDLKAVNMRDRRVARDQERCVIVQTADRDSALRVTKYEFRGSGRDGGRDSERET
jgi:hypothetical protein